MSSPPVAATAATASLVVVARRLEERLRHCSGVAGLDPASLLYTLGREGEVRGVRLRAKIDDPARLDVALDLVGLEGARLPQAGDSAREEVRRSLSGVGRPAAEIDVRFTDIASAPLSIQADDRAARARQAAASVAPESASVPHAGPEPLLGATQGRVEATEPLATDASREHVVRMSTPATGSRTVIVIRVEVFSEDAR